jgi:hypothetical protein
VQEAGKDFAKAQAEKGWKGKKDWTGAAQDFRMPLWDWADPNKPVIPVDAVTPKIRVWTPETYPVEKEVDNPLYAYKFSSESQKGTVSPDGPLRIFFLYIERLSPTHDVHLALKFSVYLSLRGPHYATIEDQNNHG